MLEIVITACSILQGATCRELPPIPLEEHVAMIGCMMATQVEAAKWTESHPNHYVQRMTCQQAGKFANL